MRERDRHKTICWSSTSPMLVQRLWRWTSIGLVLDQCRPLWSGWGGGGWDSVDPVIFLFAGVYLLQMGSLASFYTTSDNHVCFVIFVSRDIDPTSTQSRVSVDDGGPSLSQHRFSVLVLILYCTSSGLFERYLPPICTLTNTRRSMLAQCRKSVVDGGLTLTWYRMLCLAGWAKPF